MVAHHWPCGSSVPPSWAKSAPCGCPGASFMLWTLWCLRQKRTRSQDVTWVASSGLTLLWLHPLSPPSSAPSQGRNPSYRRHRCSTTDLWQPANLPSGSLALFPPFYMPVSFSSSFTTIAFPHLFPLSQFLYFFYCFFLFCPSAVSGSVTPITRPCSNPSLIPLFCHLLSLSSRCCMSRSRYLAQV